MFGFHPRLWIFYLTNPFYIVTKTGKGHESSCVLRNDNQ